MSVIICVRCNAKIDTDYNVDHTEDLKGYCEFENNKE